MLTNCDSVVIEALTRIVDLKKQKIEGEYSPAQQMNEEESSP